MRLMEISEMLGYREEGFGEKKRGREKGGN